MRKILRKLTVMVLLASVPAGAAMAGIIKFHERINTPYLGTPVTIGQPEAEVTVTATPLTGTFVDATVNDVITLGVDVNYQQYFGSGMDVKVKLELNRWDVNNNPLSDTTVYLEINYHPFDATPYIDKNSVRFINTYKYKAIITEILVNTVSVNTLPANLFIDTDIYIDRYFDFATASTPIGIFTPDPNDEDELVDTDCDGTLDEIVVMWPQIPGVEEYQLEWTFVNDYGTTAGTFIPLSDPNFKYDFRFNATRITTVNNYYAITLAFDHGYILFRVRGIGRDLNDLSQIITGVWSAAETGTVSSLPVRYHVTTPHEGDKNWQFSTTFAEEGKKKDVVSYFDGSLRNRQTVTKINSDNNTIVGETIYDHQGRPAVTVLPVPVVDPDCTTNDEEAAIKFYPNFNQDDSLKGYSKNDFDVSIANICDLTAGTMGTQSGASNYYSPANADQNGIQAYVPDAKLFPFTQVEYTPDNTGRIRRQSGVGDEFQLGTGHETKYFYGQPNQIQLDRLFATEVGDAAHYKKNVVIDPNGQASVSYLDQEGRVVATALAGDAPTNLQAIASEENAAVELTIDLFAENAEGVSQVNEINEDGDAIIYSTQLLVAYTTDYVFDYSLAVDTLFDACLDDNVCFNCVYDFNIQVRDECGALLSGENKTIGHFTQTQNGIEFVTDCTLFPSTEFNYNTTFTINLAPGNYTVSKILTVNSDAREFYIEKYLDPAYNTCIKTLEDFQNEYLAQIDPEDCNISCESCAASLGDRDDFVAQGKGTALQYDLLMEACFEPCKVITVCEATYQMLLADVSPGGQYAEFDVSGNSYSASNHWLSVLNENNYLSGTNPHWRQPHAIINGNDYFFYMDEDGSRSKIYLTIDNNGDFVPAILPTTPAPAVVFDPAVGQFYTYTEWLADLGDFISLFKPTWAKSLVTFHPEFCYYQTCSEYSEEQNAGESSSDDFDALLLNTNSFADAVANGLIPSTNPANINWFTNTQPEWDPFVVYSVNYNGYGAALQNKFTNYYNDGVQTYNMAQFAAMIVRCGNNLGVTPTGTCFDFGSGTDVSVHDQEWNMLKSLYRSAKQTFQQQYADEKALTTCNGFNDCIGSDDFNPIASGMINDFTPGGFYINNEFFQADQPCGYLTWTLYANKVKRFATPDDLPIQGPSDAAYQQYLLTGQCPNAFSLQTLLSALANNDALDATNEVLNTYPELMGVLLANNNYTITTPVHDFQWQTVLSVPTQLKVDLFDVTDNVVLCSFEFNFPGSGILVDDIEGFSNLQSTSTTSPFTFTANVIENTGSGTAIVPITGNTTCLNLADCRFQTQCDANLFAHDLELLMTALAVNGDLTGTSVDLESSAYNNPSPPITVVSSLIRNNVGTINNNLRWSYNSATHVWSIYDNSAPAVKLDIEITSVEPNTFSLTNLNSIKSFENVVSEWSNAFAIDGKDAAGNFLVTIHGTVIHDENGTIEPVSLGDCGLPDAASCEGEGYEVADDLEALLRDVLLTQTFTPNINLFNSNYWTTLLQSFLVAGTTSTSSTYNENVSGGIHSDKLKFSLNGCVLELNHSDNNAPPRSFYDLTGMEGFTATGTADAEGNMFEFYFLATYNVSGTDYTDTVFGQTCFPLRNCKECPDSTNLDTNAIAQQDEALRQQGKTFAEASVISYEKYTAAVDELNTRMGWNPSDSLFVPKMTYTKYFHEGMSRISSSYIRYMKHFDPDIDEHGIVSHCDSFTVQYGYGTNVKQEYKRYKKAVQRYNQRAAQVSLPPLTIMEDTTFAKIHVADSIGYYTDYIETMPQGTTAADQVVFYLTSTGKLATNFDSICQEYYKFYVDAYDYFEMQQAINNTCLNYPVFSPLYSFSDVEKNNLCCSQAGLDAFEAYINSFYDTTVCPGALPLMESCAILSEIDTSACQKSYVMYVQAINDFNNSPWAMANNQTLSLGYETFDEFIRAGKCECVDGWLVYINDYLEAQATGILPPAQSIDQFADCPEQFQIVGENPCEEAYDEYLNCIAVYNQWAIANGGEEVKDIVKFSTFVNEDLCYCVDAYCTALNNISAGLITDISEIKFLLSIIRVCDATTKVPCTPEVPLNTDFISPPAPDTNPCLEYMTNIALENGENAYNQYIDSVTNYIASRYNEHCLAAAETFLATYTDKEYHFTLYYYDQAGNLVKTVPPEGVELLPLDNSSPGAAALKQQINVDRTNNTHTVFTHHRLATVYEYNSLNQLVKQSMPDHDKMDIFEITLPNGLHPALETQAIQMINSNLGYLSGNVGTRGYLYQTNDGGVTWTRMNDIVASDLKKIQMVNASIGFAVGNNGTVLKTTNGGSDWDMLNTYQYNVIEHLNDLHFINATTGVIVGEKSRILKTTDGGNTFTTYLLPFSSGSFTTADQHIQSITHDGTAFYITSTRPDGIVTPVYSVIHRSLNGNNAASWTIENQISSVSINDVSSYASNMGYAAGIDGSLLHTDGTFLTAVATNTNYEFKQVLFKDQNEGLALLETSPGVLQLFKTHDKGATWTLLSDPADNYTQLYMYYNSGTYGAKVIAVGKNGLVQRVIMQNNTNFGIINLNSPTTTDLTACWGQHTPTEKYLVVASNAGNVFTTVNGEDNTATWTSVTPAITGTFAKRIEAKIVGGGNAISGTILANDGTIYSLFKANAISTFSIAPVTGLSLGYNMADLTIDAANNRIYTFDNVNDKAHKVQLVSGGPTTTTTQIPQTNAIAQANDITFTNNRLILTGTNGEIYIGTLNPPGNAITGGWQNRTNNVSPLPLNDIQFSATGGAVYAAGENGNILQRQSGGSWKTLLTAMHENINRIIFQNTTSGMITGDNGLVADAVISGSNVTVSAYNSNTANDLHDIIRSGNTVYAAGENGTVIYTPNLGVNNFAVTNQYTSSDFYGIAFKPASTQAYTVGENSLIHWNIGAGRTVIKNVFAPALKDVHFADANNGTVIGNNYTIRKTNDAGVTWKVVLPSDGITNGTVLNEIQTIDGNYALTVGNNKYLGVIVNTTCTDNGSLIAPPPNADLLSISIHPGDLSGYIGNSKSKIFKTTLTPVGGSYTLTVGSSIVANAAAPNTDINALWMFDNGSVMLAGENNYVEYFDGVSNWVTMSLPTGGGTVFRDIFFHDHLNGYVVGDAGTIIRSKDASLNANGFLTGITWQQKSIADNLNITSNPQANINAIAFATRYNGVWGGKYNISNTTTYPYVRLIQDESVLFSTYFYYDKLGRIVVSQNTKQYNAPLNNAGPRRFSYTLYDELGRVIEAGEKSENAVGSPQFAGIFGTTISNYFNPKVIDDAKLNAWINDNTGARKEVTQSFYDKTVIAGLPVDFNPDPTTQRKRITHVTYEDVFDNNVQTFDHASHYNYDIHGNVKTLLQDNRKLATTGTAMSGGGSANPVIATERFKRMDYDYDLISGNVHEVNYQNGKPDQWHHAYEYDSDNRITDVFTSNNVLATTVAPTVGGSEGGIWDNDAKYFYYLHGPLSRMETGHHDVQGTDYVYNLQGWIKGVNSNTLNTNNDPGADGTGMAASNLNALFARDVYSYSLNYFNGDYAAIDANKNLQANSFSASISGSDVEANRFNLFNGNIGSMVTTITEPTNRTILPNAMAYKYDQLNRLLEARGFNNLDMNTNQWGFSGTYNGRYENIFTYDANGNMETALAKDEAGITIDEQDYHYQTISGNKKINNRLYAVNDLSSDNSKYGLSNTQDAFDNDPVTINTVNNYRYDEIGQMKYNKQDEIEKITWTVLGKPSEVKRINGSQKKNLKFEYDAMAQRVAKHVYTSNNDWLYSEFYVRDASGNIMSTYKEIIEPANMPSYKQTEKHIYGSTAIGIERTEKEMIAAIVEPSENVRILGNKSYSMANHLGNIVSVITDKKLPVENTTTPGEVGYFIAEIKSAQDYAPFGGDLHGRDFSSDNFPNSFNGKRDDNEMDDWQDYGMRIYMKNVRRFPTLDIFHDKNVSYSAYTSFDNDPIYHIEENGNFRMTKRQQRKHPQLTNMLKNIESVVHNDPKTWEAFKNTLKLTDDQVYEIIKWGKGPKIKVKANIKDRNGIQIDGVTKNRNKILLNKDNIDRLEGITPAIWSEDATVFKVFALVLHEAQHAAYQKFKSKLETEIRDKYKKSRKHSDDIKKEPGLAFEEAAFEYVAAENPNSLVRYKYTEMIEIVTKNYVKRIEEGQDKITKQSFSEKLGIDISKIKKP
ncbi:MAG: DUF6443 domain-containing protein [Bacteroidota bacterium]